VDEIAIEAPGETDLCYRLIPMPTEIDWFYFSPGVLCLAVAFGYLFSPRFVEWTLNRDGTGRRWAALLGHERAAFMMRYVFSLILIGCGVGFICFALTSE